MRDERRALARGAHVVVATPGRLRDHIMRGSINLGDIRAVVIGGQVVHAYWRIAEEGEFRTNVACGGRISLDAVPEAALDLARRTAHVCGWNDVGIDICCHDGQYSILEANMKYGREGFRAAGLDYFEMMERLIDDGQI